MLNDPRCESILLDVGEDAWWAVICLFSTWTSPGNGTGALSPVWGGGEYSAAIRDSEMDEMVAGVKGRRERGKRPWELQELLDDFRTRLREGS
nr:MAG TPA: hypothetical protein [Caudoviricetes sp.]